MDGGGSVNMVPVGRLPPAGGQFELFLFYFTRILLSTRKTLSSKESVRKHSTLWSSFEYSLFLNKLARCAKISIEHRLLNELFNF